MTGATDSGRRAAQELFDELAGDFLGRPGITRARMFTSEGLRVNGKFFAFPGSAGTLIVKLPFDQAAELVTAHGASPVQIGRRTMRDWVGGPLARRSASQWKALMTDAERYVRELTETAASSVR